MTPWVHHLAEVADQYDGFLIDQYGVLHDGHQLYSGAADCLAQLRGAGKRVLILTNSGKRAAYNLQRLTRFGLGAAHVDGVVSSGEVMHGLLQNQDAMLNIREGYRAFLFSVEDDLVMLDGLSVPCVDRVQDATFMLLSGVSEHFALHDYDSVLHQALSRSLPLLCANPDKLRITAQGLQPAAGALAQRYADLGGPVVWVGKPYPLIYAACKAQMRQWGAHRLLAIGDSLEHDIAGGTTAGLDTCFIADGLCAQDFAACPDAQARDMLLERLSLSKPTWAMPHLNW